MIFFCVIAMVVALPAEARGSAVPATTPTFATPAAKRQASEVQAYPERPTPSQSAMPGSPSTKKSPPEPPKTEQYTLSQERYEKAIAYSRAEYVL